MLKKHRLRIIRFASCFLLVSVTLFPLMGQTMASMNPFKACTFSEMKIRLTLDGEPVTGAKVTRTVNWKKEIVDTFRSDSSGFVELPAMFESSVTQVLPVEFVSSQVINVEYKDKDYKIWVYAKRNPEKNYEFDGKPIEMRCELSDTAETQRAFNSVLKTSCKWN